MSGAKIRAQVLRAQLEQEIITGALRPGTRLDEMSLTVRFGVSRTPVREALRQLASIGLVELRPNRGALVATIGIRQLMEMFETMAGLEGLCAGLAARRLTPQERRDLREIHDTCARLAHQGAPDEYYAANVRFHETIYGGAHNGYLADQTRALRNRLAPYRRLQLRQHNRLHASFGEHAEILDAIVSGDDACAEKLMQKHLTVQGDMFNDLIANLPEDMLRPAI
ncbi:GntR family transcriptional regulator [Varunaivibrio sulfuroxidans]|uniref:GntR family transcriptional regulator n=1 Tax=Varunaivibrio sulfuroxidans TaxID=1773489 RepID=A0A4R3JCC9_9PROT|nr:GntR family transcriptional regulator [Varunaivibrio sulfuroxidans]TCS63402.1 GntR family transcriptional regulator [Varunaivibrio sulfuroxidans]WES30452.1 GntR family transcriptional regulator [Varunaivibrio sulfuroxidans]